MTISSEPLPSDLADPCGGFPDLLRRPGSQASSAHALIFAVERTIRGRSAAERLAVRQDQVKPLVLELEAFLREKRALLSPGSTTAKAISYSLTRWDAFTRFLDDGRICLSNNAAERALRGIAIGRRNWTFCGSDAGGHRAAAIYSLIETAKLNDVDPQAWLADVLAPLPDHPTKRIENLLPWAWKASREAATLAQPRSPPYHAKQAGTCGARRMLTRLLTETIVLEKSCIEDG